MKCSTFQKNKDNILDNTSVRLKAMERLAGKEIQVWHQDKNGENKGLGENMKGEHWKMKSKFEYTASGTPQQISMTMGNIPKAIRL